MTTEALAMEQTKERNLFNLISNDSSWVKVIPVSCCISYLNWRYLKIMQKFLEGCRVCQHCRLQCGTEIPELFLIKNPSLWLKDWVKSRSPGSMQFFAIWGWEDRVNLHTGRKPIIPTDLAALQVLPASVGNCHEGGHLHYGSDSSCLSSKASLNEGVSPCLVQAWRIK